MTQFVFVLIFLLYILQQKYCSWTEAAFLFFLSFLCCSLIQLCSETTGHFAVQHSRAATICRIARRDVRSNSLAPSLTFLCSLSQSERQTPHQQSLHILSGLPSSTQTHNWIHYRFLCTKMIDDHRLLLMPDVSLCVLIHGSVVQTEMMRQANTE